MRVPRLMAMAVGLFGLTAAVAAAAPGSGVWSSVAARPAAAGPAASSVSALADVAVQPGVQHVGRVQASPPTTADCEKAYKVACYQPAQIQQAYDLPAVYASGVTGKGTTIVIVDSFGSPTIKNDLSVFDRTFGLPAPPSFRVIQPAGRVPAYDPGNSDMVGWAGETTLDVEYAHTIAPGASILLVETPVSETEGVHGFPQIVTAEEYVLKHHLGDVISQSFSATEQTFPNAAAVQALRGAYQLAAAGPRHGARRLGRLRRRRRQARPEHLLPVPGDLLAGQRPPGDRGRRHAAALQRAGQAHRADGVERHLQQGGERVRRRQRGPEPAGRRRRQVDPVRPAVVPERRAERGRRPARRARHLDERGLQRVGGHLRHLSRRAGGWTPACGTSEATPLFAGIVALADQVAGHPLGLINPALYRLAAEGAPGIVDVRSGNNTVSFSQGGHEHTVRGFTATPGYDLASGVGTVNAAYFVRELAFAASH